MSKTFTSAALLLLVPAVSFAQVPPRVSWQGMLTDDSGTPLAGPVDMEFKFYYKSSGGTAAWTFDTTGVALAQGVAHLDIPVNRGGPSTLEVERTVYLELTVDGEAILPRTPLRSAPSAITLNVPALIKGERGGTVSSSLLDIWNTGNGASLSLNSWYGYGLYSKAGGPRSIYAQSSHFNGVGIEGVNTSTTTNSWTAGVLGVSKAVQGTGVVGRAEATSGPATGILGVSNSPDGFGARFEGGRGIQVEGYPTADHGGYVTAYVGLFENTRGGVSDDGIAIKVGTTGDPGTGANFIGFFDGDNELIGQVEGNGSGGVAFNTSGADYAESLPVLAGAGRLEPGDVVGIHAGAVSRFTEGADQLLVVTDRPAIIGNTPIGEDSLNRVIVSLIGQVPVRMTGPVDSGDYVISSGRNDGTAVAVSPSDLRTEHITRLLGRAWESSSDTGVRRINVAVGLDRTEAAIRLLERQSEAIRNLGAKVEYLIQRLQDEEDRNLNDPELQGREILPLGQSLRLD